ncbi:dihydrofolate reductase family protein [soil metagenome]
MGKISVFNHVSIDGFFAGPKGEIDWFKDINRDAAYEKYTQQQSQSKSTLLFGRTTYEMMRSFWPTEMAHQMAPEMADVMVNSPKIVFSKKIKSVKEEQRWKNISLISGINKKEIEKLKKNNKSSFTILGSGTIVQQLTNLGLIDSYTLVKVPIILGKGKPLFEDVNKLNLRLIDSKGFKNGIVVLNYEPAK